ncbi:helix-turn-helix domain-containing protein [Kibdelosporangium aridum]|uniref:helix-turn-helix domain-containing protein n=1 Tax=Kibdelosporangium aridum TaxID=2030 RepID=UPI0035E47A15
MEIVQCPSTLLPGPEVARCFGYRTYLAEPQARWLVPTGGVKLIIRFGDPLRSAFGTSGAVPVSASAVVVGPKDGPGRTVHAGEVHSLQLSLTPLGAYSLLGVPMRALSGAAVDLADVLGPGVNRLVERLALTGDWGARFRLLARVFGERMALGHRPDPAVVWAWQRLCGSGGGVSVSELATEIGMSRRHLSRRFHDQVGLPPKSLARVLRFRRALRLRKAVPQRSWSRIAAECGYYDQAHFNADFRALAGCTPTESVSRSDGLVLPD